MKTIRTMLMALPLAAVATAASANLDPLVEPEAGTYLRETILPLDTGLEIAAVPDLIGPGVRVAQEGPATSLIPRPRPGPGGAGDTPSATPTPPLDDGETVDAEANLPPVLPTGAEEDNAEDLAAIQPPPRPQGGAVGNLPVIAQNDGTIIRPRPRPNPEGARFIQGVIAGQARPIDPASIPLSIVTAATIIPRPRPENLGREGATTTRDDSPVSTSATAAVTLETATSPALALDEMSLIGVFGTDQARRAVLRMPDGSRVRVATGSRVAGWSVVAVDPRSLRMIRGGEVRLLELP